jgi:hypothetical protein
MSEPDSIGKPLRLVGWSGESPRSAGGGPKHPAGYRDASCTMVPRWMSFHP